MSVLRYRVTARAVGWSGKAVYVAVWSSQEYCNSGQLHYTGVHLCRWIILCRCIIVDSLPQLGIISFAVGCTESGVIPGVSGITGLLSVLDAQNRKCVLY